jgi:hypothetical protein
MFTDMFWVLKYECLYRKGPNEPRVPVGSQCCQQAVISAAYHKKRPSKNSSVEEMGAVSKQILLMEPIFPFLIFLRICPLNDVLVE